MTKVNFTFRENFSPTVIFVEQSDGAFGFTNLSMSTASSYHPHVTQIGDDWVPNDGTEFQVESSSESSFELKDL